MSEYDLFKGLSELDEELLMQPKKYVSHRMNLLFCFLAANISALISKSKPVLSIAVFMLAFGAMYVAATWFMNRRKKRKLIVEKSEDAVQ